MLALEVVVRGRCVAVVGRRREIVVRQPEVGLVGILLGIAELDPQALVDGTARVAVDLQLGDVVLEIVARVTADRPFDGLEAIAARLHGFQQPRNAFATVAGMQVGVRRAVLADAHVCHHAHGVRDRRRDHVDGAARGARPDGDRRRTLEDFERVHAPLRREIVGRRRGIGRRRNEDAVLEQCDASAAVQPGTTNADVGPEPEAFLFLQVDARHGSQRAQDIARVEDFQRLAVDLVRGPRNVGDIGLAPKDRYRVDRFTGAVIGR